MHDYLQTIHPNLIIEELEQTDAKPEKLWLKVDALGCLSGSDLDRSQAENTQILTLQEVLDELTEELKIKPSA